MTDPYSVLGIQPDADDETIKKAYRQKCKEFHPDLHPNDPTSEEKFKEVQAAYSEIMHRKQNGGQPSSGARGQGYGGQGGGYYGQSGGYSDPFGFGFDPFGGFGFGGYGAGGRNSGADRSESPEMQAAGNYIRNRYYEEALNVLNGIPTGERTARWHYYAALANSGLGNNIRAQSEARAAVDMEPGNYEYQNLLDRLQNPGQTYTTYQQAYTQPGSRRGAGNFCLQAWMYMILCNICSVCCCGGRGGFYCC